jgi:O-antigen/teichoic acid export membrane protein
LKRNSLSRDILGVFGARALWTILGTIAGVILARQLGPHDRGILALVLLLPSTVVTLVKLGIAQANVYFVNRKRAAIEDVASNSAALALTLGVLAAGVVWLLQDGLLSSFLPGVAPWALALALLRVPLLLLDDYLYGVLQAAGRFSLYNARLLISEALRLTLIVVCLVLLDMGLFAAVVIHTLVTVANMTWLVITMRRTIPFDLRVNRSLLGGQLSFGMKSYVQTLTSHMLLRADIYMVAYFLGPAETAFYSLALRFTEMVLEIPQAVGLVLYPRLASLPTEEIHRLTAQACRRTVLATAMCAILLVLFGPWIIVLWYGEAFAPAGNPLPWAAIGAMAMSVFVILTRNFTSRGMQTVNIGAGAPALLLNVGLNIVLIPTFGIVGAAVATAISYGLASAVLLAFYLPSAGTSIFDVLIAKREDLRYFVDLGTRVLARLRRLAARPSART